MPSTNPHASPLSEQVLAAIGCLVTTWATTEVSLPILLAKLAASHGPVGAMDFQPWVYARVAELSGGTNPRAAAQQIITLATRASEAHGERAKKSLRKILDIQEKRDALSHMASGPHGDKGLTLMYLAASRSKPYKVLTYTVEDIDGWITALRLSSRQLDETITDLTGWTSERLRKEHGIG